MPRSKKLPATPSSDPALVGPVLNALMEQLETLTREVDNLANRAQTLTEAIDDVRRELEWTMTKLTRNGR